MPALEVAGIDYVGVLRQDGAFVNMAERPVVVAVVSKLLGCAGRVARVLPFRSSAGGVEHADVQRPRSSWRVVARDVLGQVPAGIAAAVDGYPYIVQRPRGGSGLREDVHVLRHRKLVGEPILRVVVAEDHEDVDAGLAEAPHALDEVEASLEVPQVAIEDVSR